MVFLHEELMKLPSFPRKALESDLDLYKGGEIGKVRILFLFKIVFENQTYLNVLGIIRFRCFT